MTDTDTEAGRPRPGRARRLVLGTAVAAGLAVGATGVAMAATSPSPAPSTSGSPSVTAPQAPNKLDREGRGSGHGGMMGGPLGGAVRGEFVVPDGQGGFRTVDTQRGTVTAVSPTSITVKSADGTSKTYAVTANTLVNAARDGISTVKNGDTVQLMAVVTNGTSTVVRLTDVTVAQNARRSWAPTPKGSGTPAPSGTGT